MSHYRATTLEPRDTGVEQPLDNWRDDLGRQSKTASERHNLIDRTVKAVIHFASSLKATAPEIAPGAFLCWRDTRQWVMEAGYFQTRPDTHQ